MAPEVRTVPLASLRRLVVTQQLLGGKRPRKATPEALLSVVRQLGYVQWDPVTVVAPSHLISFWNRLDGFRPADLERSLWTEKTLFQHWTPMASIVLTEDFPLYRSLMARYPESLSHSWGSQRAQAKVFLAQHRKLRNSLLRQLRGGPRTVGEFEEHPGSHRKDAEWTFGGEVPQMLYHLLMAGEVMVVGHRGNQNIWGLAEAFLPDWVDRRGLAEARFEEVAALRALGALGAATPPEITYYFVRGRYERLRATLARLEERALIQRVRVDGLNPRELRYIRSEDLAHLDSMDPSTWEPRISLLPPFDNMVYSPSRTAKLFGFHYVREQFLPKERRWFGTYVLPVVYGDHFIGRIDPRLDKTRGELVVQAVHAEPGAPAERGFAESLAATIARFAEFVGARSVVYPSRVPRGWRTALR
ncbi:MAG TPA: crosslink repair DNA glycosylase YcaQ family protein [Thermoplasmata archaeon]|nr:crosslink repair DNA glycosylase YcaQ family protein [Thermoplasmata archaeon]